MTSLNQQFDKLLNTYEDTVRTYYLILSGKAPDDFETKKGFEYVSSDGQLGEGVETETIEDCETLIRSKAGSGGTYSEKKCYFVIPKKSEENKGELRVSTRANDYAIVSRKKMIRQKIDLLKSQLDEVNRERLEIVSNSGNLEMMRTNRIELEKIDSKLEEERVRLMAFDVDYKEDQNVSTMEVNRWYSVYRWTWFVMILFFVVCVGLILGGMFSGQNGSNRIVSSSMST